MPRVGLVLLSLSVVLPYGTGDLSTGTNVAATNGTTANDTAANGTANGTACGQFDPDQQKILSGLRCAIGAVCLVLTAIVLFVFLCDKQPCKNLRRRILLFLTISTVLYLIVFVMQVSVSQRQTIGEDLFCKAIGFFIQYFGWQELVLVSLIAFHFTYIYCNKTHAGSGREPSTRTERILYLILVLAPLIPAGLGFINNGYGETVGWCWIQLYSSDCNKTEGILRQLFLWYVWCVVLGTVCLCLTIFTVCSVCKQTEDVLGTTKKEVLLLLSYPIIFVLVNAFELLSTIVTYAASNNQPVIALRLIYAVIAPISAAAIPLTFAILYCCYHWENRTTNNML